MRGWAKKGQRCLGHRPGHWNTYTILSYLKYDGSTDGIIFSGGTDKNTFKNFMEKVLLPVVKSGDIIIMDNLNVHKNSFDKIKFNQKDVEIKYLPRYSPEYNPIEMMWSKIKTEIRKKEPRDFLSIWRETSVAKLKITQEDVHGWYKESGYCH